MSRDRAKELAKKKGYKIASNVSKNLDILVFGEKSGSKLKKARDLKINIINEKKFLNIMIKVHFFILIGYILVQVVSLNNLKML